TPTRRGDHVALAVAFFIVLPLQYYLIWIDWYGFFSVVLTPYFIFLLVADAFFIVLPLQYYLIWIDWYGLFSVFIPVYVFLLLAAIAALRQDTKNFMGRVAETQWGLMISVFSLSHVPALLSLHIPGYE